MTKVTFETAALADAIKKAARVAPNKGAAFDKAAGIVLDIQAGLPIVIRATNLELFSMEWVDAIEIEGEDTRWRIGAPMLAQVIGSLPIGDGKVTVLEEVTSGFSSQVHLTAGRTKARFNLLDDQTYPEWKAFDPDDLTVVKDFGGRMAMVAWAVAKSEPPMSGVHLNGTHVIATDRYKLAVAPLEVDLATPITVPGELLSSMVKQTGELAIGIEENTLRLMPDDYTQLRSVIYSGDYPKVERIMRTDYPEQIKVNKEHLLEILNRANNFAGGDRLPTLKMFIGLEEIAVMMNNEEIGLLGDVLEVPGQASHDRWEVRFTPKNLIDAVNAVPNSEFDLHYDMEKQRRPVYIDGGSGYQCWVVPRTSTQQESE